MTDRELLDPKFTLWVSALENDNSDKNFVPFVLRLALWSDFVNFSKTTQLIFYRVGVGSLSARPVTDIERVVAANIHVLNTDLLSVNHLDLNDIHVYINPLCVCSLPKLYLFMSLESRGCSCQATAHYYVARPIGQH